MIDERWKQKQLAAMAELERMANSDRSLKSVVEMRNDYVQDMRLCLTMVAFIPEAIASRIEAELIEPLRDLDSTQYFYPPRSLHLTIQNVRTISDPPTFNERDIYKIINTVSDVFDKTTTLSFELNGLLRLRTSLAVRAFAEANLLTLCRELRRRLAQAGYPDNKDYVSEDVVFGNITICRYTHEPNPEFVRAFDHLSNFSGELAVSEVSLISTNAICHPGSTKVWKRFQLGQSTAVQD